MAIKGVEKLQASYVKFSYGRIVGEKRLYSQNDTSKVQGPMTKTLLGKTLFLIQDQGCLDTGAYRDLYRR